MPQLSRTVFLIDSFEVFERYEPIINALQARGQVVFLVVIPWRDVMNHWSDGSAYDYGGAVYMWEWLVTNGYHVEPLVPPDREAERLRSLAPTGVFLPGPYIESRHPSLAPANLDLPVFYLNYSFNVYADERLAFELPFYRECSMIFAENAYSARRWIAAGVAPEKVAPTGLPILDYWDSFAPKPLFPTVLWCPHWSVDRYSTFLDSYSIFLDEAARRPDVRFIIRPHPLLRLELRKRRSWTADDEVRFFSRVKGMLNVTIAGVDTPTTPQTLYPDYRLQFRRASAMVTDGVGFLAEFAYTGKPLLLTEAPTSPGWNAVGNQIADLVGRSNAIAGLATFLDDLSLQEDPVVMPRREAVARLFYRPQGGSAEAVARQISEFAK